MQVDQARQQVIFPTSVGVNRPSFVILQERVNFPHERGGEPPAIAKNTFV